MSYQYTPESGEAHFRDNVLLEGILKLSNTSTIVSTVLDGRFTASNSYADGIVATEATARTNADTSLNTAITAVSTTVSANKTEYDAYVVSSTSALAGEVADREAGDLSNATNLTTHITTYNSDKATLESAIATEVSDRQTAVSAEATARTTAHTNLSSNISANTTLIGTEKASLKNEILYGAGNTSATPVASQDSGSLNRIDLRLTDVESQIDAFSPDSIEQKVSELITNHDTQTANLNTAVALLNEYFVIDVATNSVSIKAGVTFNVPGTFNHGT